MWPTIRRWDGKPASHPDEWPPLRHQDRKDRQTSCGPLHSARPLTGRPAGYGDAENLPRRYNPIRKLCESYWISTLGTLASHWNEHWRLETLPPSLLTPPRTLNTIAPGIRCHLSLLYRFCLAWRRSTSDRNVAEIVLLYCYIKSFWNNTIPSYIATIARNFRREPGCLEIHHTTLEYPKWSWKDLMTFWHFSHKTGHRHYQHLRGVTMTTLRLLHHFKDSFGTMLPLELHVKFSLLIYACNQLT